MVIISTQNYMCKSQQNIYNRIQQQFKSKMDNSIRSINAESVAQWQKNELVWAKITGYPWWPGKIIEVPGQKTLKYKVKFIGDNTYAFLSPNKIVSYADGWHKYSTLQKNFRGFIAARAEADEIYSCSLKAVKAEKNELAEQLAEQKTLMDKQIQIINQASDKCDWDFTPQQNQIFNSLKGNQKRARNNQASNQKKPRKIISKRRQIKRRIVFVNKLLDKYNLNEIPDNVQQTNKDSNTCRSKNSRAIKKAKIARNSYSCLEIQAKLIIKICKILRAKGIDRSKSYQISSITGKQDKGAHRQFLSWLISNDQRTILQSYGDWQRDGQKIHQVTGQTECQEIQQQ